MVILLEPHVSERLLILLVESVPLLSVLECILRLLDILIA